MSAAMLLRWLAVLPIPWPACMSSRNKMGLPLLLAACKRAAALPACQASTRGSFMPCTSSTPG